MQVWRRALLPGSLLILILISLIPGLDRMAGFKVAVVPMLLGGAAIAYPTLATIIERRKITAGALVAIAIIGSAYLEEYLAAAVVALMMLAGEFLEEITLQRTRNAVRELVRLTPDVATVDRHGAWVQVPLREVRVGDTRARATGRACAGRRHGALRRGIGQPGHHHGRIDAYRQERRRARLCRHHEPGRRPRRPHRQGRPRHRPGTYHPDRAGGTRTERGDPKDRRPVCRVLHAGHPLDRRARVAADTRPVARDGRVGHRVPVRARAGDADRSGGQCRQCGAPWRSDQGRRRAGSRRPGYRGRI